MAVAEWPMNYLYTHGPRANPATALTWGLMDLSIAVVAIITGLVVVGVLVRRIRVAPGAEIPAAKAGSSGLPWLYVGVALTVIALLVSLVWTVQVLAQINSPADAPRMMIEVTGRQWWWEVRYRGADPAQTFTAANEIHIPTGSPVLVRLYGGDVIHSFWVPALTGKTDTIPGRMNVAWLQADKPGVYRGQCAEYCGVQHAKMALYVVAQPPAEFEAWREAQVAPATSPPEPAQRGMAVFHAHCSVCHAIRGTGAGGVLGPDLTHLMSRRTIASGILPNTPQSLEGWVSNPEALKPGVRMPATNLSGPNLLSLTAYLETLK